MEGGRIVVIDEDTRFRQMLADRLVSEGYDVRMLDSPSGLVESAGDLDADLVVSALSEHGPGIRELRERSDVLFVAMFPRNTGMPQVLDVIDLGADAALVKPFSARELVTTTRALLRRSLVARTSPPRLVFDGLVIDAGARTVIVRGERVELPAREFDLLLFLASSPGQVFSRTQIMTKVWAIDDGVGTATVTEHVRRTRQRIEEVAANPRWIQTVRSVGYRFSP